MSLVYRKARRQYSRQYHEHQQQKRKSLIKRYLALLPVPMAQSFISSLQNRGLVQIFPVKEGVCHPTARLDYRVSPDKRLTLHNRLQRFVQCGFMDAKQFEILQTDTRVRIELQSTLTPFHIFCLKRLLIGPGIQLMC